jgi:hypothetical protein
MTEPLNACGQRRTALDLRRTGPPVQFAVNTAGAVLVTSEGRLWALG